MTADIEAPQPPPVISDQDTPIVPVAPPPPIELNHITLNHITLNDARSCIATFLFATCVLDLILFIVYFVVQSRGFLIAACLTGGVSITGTLIGGLYLKQHEDYHD